MTKKENLKIGHLRITDHLALGITKHGYENGEFQFDYLNLETKSYTGWNPLAIDLRTGALDAACILAPISMELFQNGINLKLLLQTHKSGSVLIKNKRANINSIEDFKGKTILIPHYLSVHHLLFDKLLRDCGIPIGVKDVKFEVVAPSEIPEIMEWDEEGKVGGFIVAEPFGTQVVQAGYGEEFKLSKDIWKDHPCCVLVVRDEFIKNNPEAVQELVNAFIKAGYIIKNELEKTVVIGAAFLNQDISVIKHVLTEPADRVTFTEMYPVVDDFEYIQTYMTTHIKAMSGKIDLNSFIDTSFAEKAGAK
ncbi:MAG: ABC transporter substrate-binding protein [candidate division WOR-3 bacterium]